MWKSSFNEIDPATRSAGAALLCAITRQYLFSRQSELCSEILAWLILPIVFKITSSPRINKFFAAAPCNFEAQPTSAASLSIVTVGLVAFCLSTAGNGKSEFLKPALTPLLLLVQKYLGSELRPPRTSNSRFFHPFVNTILGTTFAASFFIFILSDWNLRGHALSIIPVAALLVVYTTLTPRTDKSSRYLPSFDIEGTIIPLSLRVVVVLGLALVVEILAFDLPRSTVVAISALGLAKALFWYFIIQTARNSSWNTTSIIETFSVISTRDPFTQSSDTQSLFFVIASLLALGQTVHILPKQAKAKSWLWLFSLVSLVPYLANILTIRLSQTSSLIYSQQHPVEALIQNANATFNALLHKQSRNYTAAHNEYRRRYGTETPPGFQAWYEFAKFHQSPIIDDFDMIYDAISPFWKLSGQEVLEIMSHIQNEPNNELWLCTFSGLQAKTECSHPQRTFDRHNQLLFNKLLENLRGVLPDVKFLVNHLDEPRVLIPSAAEGFRGNVWFNLTDMSRRPVWDTLTRFCPSQGGRRNVRDGHTVETFALPFVINRVSDLNLCWHPEYRAIHGLSMSPSAFRLIEGSIPVLTTGSLSTMGDILYPSPAYIESEFQYVEANDVDWDKKINNLYWAGSTTGGFASTDQWRDYHRQRFVSLAQNLRRRQHYYLREKGGVISRVSSSFLNSRLFDVAFTRIFQCKKKYCRDQHMYFKVKSWADKDKALRSRLAFDIDGNGISGRYYKLLASKSAPLKQTLFREWHDERLVPWVHYIPVSQSLEELPELVFYLTSTEAGQKRAREIAEQGRDWFSKAFRDVDLTVYTYRLMLELARLQDPKRPAA
ncbi:F-actin-capping protein subunit beta [Coccidioides posadasii str. Silveira]|nr:F-actin-capping protein subunit beta [Coccidioides posadasii str. Silveira]